MFTWSWKSSFKTPCHEKCQLKVCSQASVLVVNLLVLFLGLLVTGDLWLFLLCSTSMNMLCCTFLFSNWSQLCVLSEISQVWQNIEIYLAGLASWLLVSEHLYLSTPPSSLSLARWAWQIHVFMINLNVQHYLSSYFTLGIGLLISSLAFLGCCGALTTSRSKTLFCRC